MPGEHGLSPEEGRAAHKGPVLAVALVLLALVGGIIGTTLGLLQAKNEAWKADREQRLAQTAREDEAEARRRSEAARDRAARTLEAMTANITGDVLAQQKEITPEQKQFLTTALGYFRELLKEKENDEGTRKRIAGATYRVGTIEARLGRKEEAVAMFRQARELLGRLAAEYPGVGEYRHYLGESHNCLGLLLGGMGKRDEAETQYRAAIAVLRKLVGEHPGNPRHRHALASSHSNLGALLRGVGKGRQAETECLAAIAILRKLVAERPTDPRHRHSLGGCHVHLGHVLSNRGELARAETAYRAGRDLFKPLVARFPADPDYRLDLATSHDALGMLLRELGKRGQAEQEHRAAVLLLKELTSAYPAAPRYREHLAASHNHLGSRLHEGGKWDEAEKEHRAAIALQEKLVAEFPASPGYRHLLGQSHNNLALALRGLKKWAEAETACRAARVIFQKLHAESPAVPIYRKDLATSHTNLGRALAGRGEKEQGETELRAAITIQKKLRADFPANPTYRQELARSHGRLATLLADLGKPAHAEAEHRAALDLFKRLAADFPALPAYRSGLANSHTNLGHLLQTLGKRDQAEIEYRAALDIDKKLMAGFPGVPEHGIGAGGTMCNLGNLALDAGRLSKSLAWCDQAIATLSPIHQQEPNLADARRFLRNSHWGRADILGRLGRHEEAARNWATALSLSSADNKPLVQRGLMLSRARAGQFEPARKAAEQLAGSDSWEVVYECACVYALAHAGTRDDKQAARAVELLHRAIANGLADAAKLKKEGDLASLRERDDFRLMVANLEKALAAMSPAERRSRAAIDIHKKWVAQSPAAPKYRHNLARAHNSLGILLVGLGKREQAEPEYRAALGLYKKLAADFPAAREYPIDLGGVLCNLGHLFVFRARLEEALRWYDQAITTLSAAARQEPSPTTGKEYLGYSQAGRAATLDLLARHTEAARDWAAVLEGAPASRKPVFQRRLMLSRARAGQLELALQTAEQLARSDSARVLYDCARARALAHARSKDEKQARRAVELLRRAVAGGFPDMAALKKETDLESLRGRDDFKKLLKEVEAKKKESAPKR
jgi:tetratricopeptide (TPR) repeat protein